MAAGQQRKRLASSNLHELKGKRKKRLDSSDYILNLRSHVHLQWDEGQKRVVAKREQIGITWKDFSPYVDSMPKIDSGLADVFSFPKEVFDLDNLMEVLSHEVWLTCLSVSERKLLMQFLPCCAFAEETVRSLLTGENFHFGNPFLKWSTLLCSSDLHPDVLLQKERQTRVSMKQYNLEINKYHTNMVAVLRMLKKKLETCEDPEKLWRKPSTLNVSSEGSEKPHDYSIQKEELPLKMFNRYVDEAKYMAYIKVNKKQFKMLKELKHSGDHIQSKSICNVLGDIKNFHVYPYKLYEDEENNRLREHWVQVTKDTHAAFERYNKRKFLKMQRMECLEKELAESRTWIHDKAEESVLGNSPENHIEVNIETEHHSIVSTDEEDSRSRSVSAHDQTLERIPSLNSTRELNPSISDQETTNENTLRPAKNTPDAPPQSMDKMDSSQMVEELKALISPLNRTWISTNCEDSNHQNPSQAHSLFASSDVPLNQCQHFQVQAAPIINSERESMEQVAGRLLPSSFSAETTPQLFSSYIQSHDEVISNFPMASDILSSHMNYLSQPGLQLLMNDGNLRETNGWPINERQKELYMQNMIEKNLCTKIRYENQLGYYPSSSSRCTLQSCVTDRVGRQNWFPNEHQSHNAWSGIDSNGVQSGSGDGSLFSVLPEFRNLPFRSSFDVSGSERLLRPPNYIGMSMAEPYFPTQVSSSTGLTSNPIPSVNMIRINQTHQQPQSLQESAMKPFMRHWHQ